MSEPQSTLARIRSALLWIGAIIVVITDLLNTLELARIEHLLHK
jgi:hypothetical protein